MKIKDLYKLLLLLPVMTACSSEEAVIADNTESPTRKLTVRASLPDAVESRTYITYGNQDFKQELFRWNYNPDDYDANDYITVFNVSKLSSGVGLNVIAVDDKTNSAIFESTEIEEDFKIEEGDVIFVSYWDATERISGDNMIIEMDIDHKPQPIVDNPFADDYMTYMQGSLKMYDIVTAGKDGIIPDIHFKHLSGIMRVTLRNETGDNIYPKSLKFECQGEKPIFISYLCCGVDTEAADGASLIIYDETNGTEYSDSVTYHTNNYTAAEGAAVGGAIAPGKTYDLYVPFIPRFKNNIKADNLSISLEGRDSSSESKLYSITLNPFGVAPKAGLRYWFNLTAVKDGEERKLMFTNEWKAQHPDQTPAEGEETPSE